ncbi:MAG TPA: hypothetical protein VND83_01850, partial [Acidimicrobiales bacterium]|nr:hypothetical protein [Acidimicrobiales bacterium]
TSLELHYLRALPRGTALVRYGAHRSIVRLRPNDRDLLLIDTDAAMRQKSYRFAPLLTGNSGT